tara:strand:- start:74 stop:1867 length:1794 start_codon:yes stop_codon:yes gene_type:complete
MAGAIIEVKYFNTFLLKKINNGTPTPVWNGSFGMPNDLGASGTPPPAFLSTGYPVQSGLDQENSWVIEESRIRGGFNNTSVDFGAKAYIVEDEPTGTRRFNTLIYSGIFNSRTGINNTNVFSVAEDITKSLDPANGSIQKLYAEDTNLSIFQELKVSRALIDKDAIYSAEGGGAVTSSNLVIGAIQPYLGKYGISKNPESFGIYGNRKYFTDRNNNVVLRLAGDGITEISSYGMKDFFRDNLALSANASVKGKVLGSYDIYGNEYVVSIQNPQSDQSPVTRINQANTLNFDEKAQGWVSFFDYEPDEMFSLRNNFYSVKTIDEQFLPDGSPNPEYRKAKLFRHYSNQVSRGNFYGINNDSSITFVFNPNPTNSKSFKTISYEGSNGWQVDSIISDQTGPVILRNFAGNTFVDNKDNTSLIYSYTEGEYVLTEAKGAVAQDVTASANVTLDPGSITGFIFAGNFIFSDEITQGSRRVVSYNNSTGALVLTEPVNLTSGNIITFNGIVQNTDYLSVFGSNVPPPLNKYYSGFVLKENKYVANLVNNTGPSPGEVNFGKNITGIKGFYATVKMSTDSTTDPGGEKTLFSVESNYDMNNGY